MLLKIKTISNVYIMCRNSPMFFWLQRRQLCIIDGHFKQYVENTSQLSRSCCLFYKEHMQVLKHI